MGDQLRATAKTRVIVIGSGFGGLAAAIRLQSQGVDTTILEKRKLPGGRAYVHEEKGFTFDMGPTVITAPNCLEELWELSGRKLSDSVELIPVSPLYRLHYPDGVQFDYTQDLESTLKEISKLSPEDAESYPAFLQYTENVFREGYEKLAHVPFLHFQNMVSVAPELLKLKAYRTVYGQVSSFIKHPKLREAFSFHSLLVGGNPFTASSIYTLIHFLERKWGVYYPRGGTGALIRAMVKLFEDLGGVIHFDAEVKEIVTREGRVQAVRTADWEEPCDCVVSNADVARTYLDLLKNEPRTNSTRGKLSRARYSNSLFLVYFGTNRTYPNMKQHNVVFGPRYRGLLKDIFSRGILSEDFSLYLHVPSRTDPDLAPPGCESFYALSCVPHLGKGQIDWEREKRGYADRILDSLEDRCLPDLRKHVVVEKIFTPRDFEGELNAHLGSAFSLEPVLWQSAYFRMPNRDPNIRGLYIVGAGTHPGAGIPGVVGSAKATVGVLLSDLRYGKSWSVTSDLYQSSKDMIVVGSKSFSLAAKLFDPKTREGAFFLYGWCRYCDDQIDKLEDRAAQVERLKVLEEMTRSAFGAYPPSNSIFRALYEIHHRYDIPQKYALDLLEGFRMDLEKTQYETIQDLSLYCYRVAGTVGLMMSHIMGVSRPEALKLAVSLGIAMQLTNIARDVREDFEMGRVYLPLQWLREVGVGPSDLGYPENREKVYKVVERVLKVADQYYQEGSVGLKYLQVRASIAVAVASFVYRSIGTLVMKRGVSSWEKRAIVSPLGKAWAVMRGIGVSVCAIPYRLLHPFEPEALSKAYLFEG